jgi:hypothetical protein
MTGCGGKKTPSIPPSPGTWSRGPTFGYPDAFTLNPASRRAWLTTGAYRIVPLSVPGLSDCVPMPAASDKAMNTAVMRVIRDFSLIIWGVKPLKTRG